MKCTTKILIGIVLSGIVMVTVGTILLCTIDWPKKGLVFDGKPVQLNVAPFRVVNVKVEAGERLKEDPIFLEGNLSILPAVGGQHLLSYPEELEPYLSVVTKNDTLNLIFKLSESTLPDKQKNEEWIFLVFPKMTLTADSSLVAVHSDARRLSVELMNLKSDSVSLEASWMNVDSCHFRSLFVKKTGNLNLKNSQIQSVYLDLDDVRSWNVAKCQIENEYLTGGGNHYNDLNKGECRHLYWKPKNDDAQLRVTLKEGASVSLLD